MSNLNAGKITSTAGIVFPKFAKTSRPSNPDIGMVIFQTTDSILEVWNGSSWQTVGSTPALYDFTTFTFTSNGTVGRSGPTLASVSASYSARGATWATNNAFFTGGRADGFQLWTVPKTGVYEIEVAGARGQIPNNSYTIPYGCIVRARISLNQADVLELVVGQTPYYVSMEGQAYQSLGAGGGGSFVSKYANGTSSPLIIAGGAGGGYVVGNPTMTYCHGQTRQIPLHHYNGTNLSNVALTAGYGGKGWDPGGGGGYYGDGQAWGWGGNSTSRQGGDVGDGIGTFGRGITATASTSPTSNRFAAGGFSNIGNNNGYEQYKSVGGFGGGGGGDTGYNAAGGGGGYTGGWSGGGYLDSSNTVGLNQWGVGGGSYIISGATTVATSDGQYDGSSSFNGSAITNLNTYNTSALTGIGNFVAGQGYIKITAV